MVPATPLNCPRTVEIIMCFTEKPAAVCAGSICQVVVAADAEKVSAAESAVPRVILESRWPMEFSFSVFEYFFQESFGCNQKLFRCGPKNILQGCHQIFQARGADVAKLAHVKPEHRNVELLENVQSLRGDTRFDHAAIISLPLTANQFALFHAVQ